MSKATISCKKYGENCYLCNFVFLPNFPDLTMLRIKEQKLRQTVLWYATLYRERRKVLKTLSKTPIIFCHWLSESYKKKRKMRYYACRFEKLKCALMSWLCYGTLCHDHNDCRRWQKGAKNVTIMLLSYFTYHLLEKRYYKKTITNVALLLSSYVYIFAILSYLSTVNQWLTIFFSKNYVSLERSP